MSRVGLIQRQPLFLALWLVSSNFWLHFGQPCQIGLTFQLNWIWKHVLFRFFNLPELWQKRKELDLKLPRIKWITYCTSLTGQGVIIPPYFLNLLLYFLCFNSFFSGRQSQMLQVSDEWCSFCWIVYTANPAYHRIYHWMKVEKTREKKFWAR